MAEARLAQRHQRALLDPAAVISGLGIAHDLTRVADGLQVAGDDFVERRALRAGDLDNAVARRGERHLGDGLGNIVRRDRLEQAGRNPDDVPIRTRIGDGAEEFHKLGRADDRERDAGGYDQFFLGEFGAEVAIVAPVDSDDGQRDMVPDARGGLRREKVAAGGLEELQHRLVFERGRVREVDHDLRARDGFFDALAGDRVDAAIGRGGDDLVTSLAQNGDGLGTDEAGAADDDDLHGFPFLVDDRRPQMGSTQVREMSVPARRSRSRSTIGLDYLLYSRP